MEEVKCPLKRGKKRSRKIEIYCWKCDKLRCNKNHSTCSKCEWQGTSKSFNEKKKKCFNCGSLKFDFSELSD